MSECVVRMEMPENCCECQLRQEDYEMGDEFCPFTGVECLSIGRQNNCPIICQLPEGHGRLIDAEKLKAKKYHSDITHENAVAVAEIDWMPTIVPAEAERKVYASDAVTPTDTPTVPAERSDT